MRKRETERHHTVRKQCNKNKELSYTDPETGKSNLIENTVRDEKSGEIIG